MQMVLIVVAVLVAYSILLCASRLGKRRMLYLAVPHCHYEQSLKCLSIHHCYDRENDLYHL